MPFPSAKPTKFIDRLHYRQPLDGKQVYDKMLQILESDNTLKAAIIDGQGEAGKNELFKYFIHEIAQELSAATYTSGVSGHETIDRLSFEDLAESFLASKGYEHFSEVDALPAADKLKLYKEFTAKVKTIHPRILEQTPHPTEPLDTRAINSYTALRNFAREEVRPLFESSGMDVKRTNLPIKKLAEKFRDFYDKLEPPPTGLSADNEQARSAVLSKNIYDSVPILASNLIKTRRLFGFDSIDAGQKKQAEDSVREFAVDTCSDMVRNYTWSPMDMDGNLQMDRRGAEKGLEGKKLAISQQYMEDLASFAVRLREQGDNKEAVEQIQYLIWRLFGNIEKIYPTLTNETNGEPLKDQVYFDKIDTFINTVAERTSPKVQEFIHNVWKIRNQPETRNELNLIKYARRTGHFENKSFDTNQKTVELLEEATQAAEARLARLHPGTFLENHSNSPESVMSPAEIRDKLAEIAEIPGVRDVKYHNNADAEDILSDIDALRLKVASYGNSAQKITWRQSAKVHQGVMAQVLNYIQGRESVLDSGRQLTPKPDFMASIRHLNAAGKITLINPPGELLDTRDLIQILTSTDPEVQQLANQIRTHLRKQVRSQKSRAYEHKDALAYMDTTEEQETHFAKYEQEIYTYETLDVVDFINRNGRDFGHILTAETDGPEALWCVYAEQLVMQNPQELLTPEQTKEQPQIIALTEYLDDIVKLPATLAQAMAFEPFRKEMEARAPETPSWLQVWDEEKGELVPMKVKDLLAQIQRSNPNAKQGQQVYDEMLATIRQRLAETHNTTPQKITQAQLDAALGENVLSYVAMVAGSDSFKSAGAAIEYTIERRFDDAQKKLMAYDTLLNFYMGNGSAMHRVGITSALIRTQQGRQMKEGAETLAAETMNVIGKQFASKYGHHDLVIGKPQNDAEKFVVALHNIGNRANMPTAMSAEDCKHYDDLCYESEAFYSTLYKDYGKNDTPPAVIVEAKKRIADKLPKGLNSKDFGNYMKDVTLSKLDAVSHNGARYAFRPGKPEAYVDSMRAIGYGAAHGYTGFGQPHLTFALAHTLEADKSPETLLSRYINNPYLQGRVNRAVKDLVVEFKPDTGWKNVASGCGLFGLEYHYDATSETPPTIQLGEEKFTIQDLVKGDADTLHRLQAAVENHRQAESLKYTDKDTKLKPIDAERVVKNIRMAAVMESEARAAIRSTVSLFEQFGQLENGKPIEPKGRKDDAETLLACYQAVSPAKGSEMAFLRGQYQHSLDQASEAFKKYNQTEKLPKKTEEKGSEAYKEYRNAYYDIALMKTILETSLNSDKFPSYAIDIASNHLWPPAKSQAI